MTRNRLKDVNVLLTNLQEIVDKLREDSAAGRCTLRYDAPDRGWDVEDVVVESLGHDVRPLKGVRTINQRATNGVRWMVENRKFLFQPDLRIAEPPAPAALRDVYQATAQMLAPLFIGNQLRGWISVHWVDGVREITASDQENLERANSAVMQLLAKLEEAR